MMIPIDSVEDFSAFLSQNPAVLGYFSHEHCNVCKTLKPKLSEQFSNDYPELKQVYINIENSPELAARYSVFTVPVILVFFEGRETIRKARATGVDELSQLIKRPYSLFFE